MCLLLLGWNRQRVRLMVVLVRRVLLRWLLVLLLGVVLRWRRRVCLLVLLLVLLVGRARGWGVLLLAVLLPGLLLLSILLRVVLGHRRGKMLSRVGRVSERRHRSACAAVGRDRIGERG